MGPYTGPFAFNGLTGPEDPEHDPEIMRMRDRAAERWRRMYNPDRGFGYNCAFVAIGALVGWSAQQVSDETEMLQGMYDGISLATIREILMYMPFKFEYDLEGRTPPSSVREYAFAFHFPNGSGHVANAEWNGSERRWQYVDYGTGRALYRSNVRSYRKFMTFWISEDCPSRRR